jgi:hypothetical protein
MMNEANTNAAAAVAHRQRCTTLRSNAMQHTSAMAQAKKETLKQPMKQAINSRHASQPVGVNQYSTGSTLESKWLMLRGRNSVFRWYRSYCSIAVIAALF